MDTPPIVYDDFAKVDMRIGRIVRLRASHTSKVISRAVNQYQRVRSIRDRETLRGDGGMDPFQYPLEIRIGLE